MLTTIQMAMEFQMSEDSFPTDDEASTDTDGDGIDDEADN